MAFTPLHDRVLVERVEGEEKTAGGLIIPDNAKEKPAEGVIVSAAQVCVTTVANESHWTLKKVTKFCSENGPALKSPSTAKSC